MKLHAALGASLMYTRGAGSEIGAAWTKALEIAESLDDAEYQLRSLWGLWLFHINSGQHRVALALAQRFCSAGGERPDPNDRLIGERMIGVSQYYLGDQSSARRHLERVLAAMLPPTSSCTSFAFRSTSGWWARGPSLPGSCGCRDCRIRRCAPPNAASRTRARPTMPSRCVTLWPWRHARSRCGSAIWPRRNIYVEMLLDHSTRHALALWHAFGRSYQGVLVIQRGDLAAGLRLLRAGLTNSATAKYAALRLSAFLVAGALARAGQIVDGLAMIEEAIARSQAHRRTLADRRVAAHQRRASSVAGRARSRGRRPRIISGRRSTGRAGKARCPGNCAPPRASRGCCAIRAVPPRRRRSSSRSTTGLPRASTRPISKPQRRCSTLFDSRLPPQVVGNVFFWGRMVAKAKSVCDGDR